MEGSDIGTNALGVFIPHPAEQGALRNGGSVQPCSQGRNARPGRF